MSVKIRCRKTGANNDPSFRIVATDSRSPRDGKCLETLGWYDPKLKEKNFFLKLDRVAKWEKDGAIISPVVKTMMKKAKAGKMAAGPTPPKAASIKEPTANAAVTA